jgi:hypothetical protein
MHKKCLEWVAHKLHSLVVHHHWDHTCPLACKVQNPLHFYFVSSRSSICQFICSPFCEFFVVFFNMLGLKQNTLNKSFNFGGHFGHEVDEYKFNYMQWLSLWDLCEQFVATILYGIDKLLKFVRFWTHI